ncbi:MAG: hypothetical protein R2822_26885 [Spirosomataceae bacterium]
MKFLNYLVGLLLFAIVFIFYRFVDQNAVNVPYFDDYAYLEYMIKFIQAPTTWDFLRELEYKHNGHGVITAKLVFWMDYLLTGQVNYRALILVGSGLIFVLFGYFWRLLSANQLPFFYLLPIALYLFTPAYHENIFWAAALWQYTASFVIGIVTYYLLAKKSFGTLIGAIITGFLLTYTNGNGLFGMYVATLIPLLQTRYRTVAIWLVACMATTTIFYWYYPFGFGSLGQEKNLYHSFLTVLSFFGASASYFRERLPEVAVLGGLITIALLGLGMWVGVGYVKMLLKSGKTPFAVAIFIKKPENLSLLALLAWLLVTGLGVATARAGNSLETPARYMIYSVMAVVSLYIAFLILLPKMGKQLLALGMTAVGAFFMVGTYLFAAPNVINFRNSLVADAYSLQQHRRVSGKLETMTNLVTKKYFDEAVVRKMYSFPDIATMTSQVLRADTTPSAAISLIFDTDTLPAYGKILIYKIKNETINLAQDMPQNGLFLLLSDSTHTYLTAARQTPNRDRKSFLKTGKYFKEGFEALVFQDNVPEGKYRVGLLWCEGQTCRTTYLNQYMTIQDFQK